MADYYDTLGVARTADQKDIQQAFRRLARKYHPDMNRDADAETKFKEINEAYEVLSDAESRSKYDLYGDRWRDADRIEAQRRASTSTSGFGFGGTRRGAYTGEDLRAEMDDILGDFDSIFSDIRRTRSRGGRRSVRENAPVSVSLAEAYRGVTVTASLTIAGALRKFEVDIPPGIDTGGLVRVAPEPGTELIFDITVKPDSRFRRSGADLYTDVEVDFEDAILGGEADVSTLDGRRIRVTIPAGSQNGQNIRLRGEGMPRLNAPNDRGSLFVTVRPQIPDSLTDEQRKLVEQLRDLRNAERAGAP